MTDLAAPARIARTLIERMRTRYAALRSYQDRGLVRVEVSAHELPLDLEFETHYRAPDCFRFAFRLPHPDPSLREQRTSYVIASDGVEAWTLTRFPGAAPELRQHRALRQAVAGVAGVSCGAAQTIARLLMPDRFGTAFDGLDELGVAGECAIDGADCLRIAGTHPYAGPEELCIGRHDALLRKLSKRSANMPVAEMRGEIALDREQPDLLFVRPE